MPFLIALEDASQALQESAPSFLPASFWTHLAEGAILSLVFGLVGIVLLLLGYWLFDRITPRIDFQKELNEKNMALGLVLGAMLLGIAVITAVAIH